MTVTEPEPEEHATLPAAGGPKPVRRRYRQLAVDDKRILYITIIGGLAANVGLVLVVALGVLEVHLIHRYRDGLDALGHIATVQGVASASLMTATLGIMNALKGAAARIVAHVIWVILGLAAAITILAFVGYAAGVR